jgi:hypothetical protein
MGRTFNAHGGDEAGKLEEKRLLAMMQRIIRRQSGEV